MKMIPIIAVLFIALALPVHAGIDEGEAAYARGDYAGALREFRTLAGHGDALAKTNLGSMYELGRGVARNETESVMWYRKAAEQGFAPAQEALRKLGRQ